MKTILLNLILSLPFVYLLVKLFIIDDVNDPIKYIYTISGSSATIILLFTITISMIKDKINLMKYRKNIGLMGFFYVLVHMLNFIILDAELNFDFVLKETLDKPFIYLGMISFFIVLFMAITSTKNLYRKYNKYHKFIYLALILITVHWVMAQKSINIPQFAYLGIIFLIGFCKLIQQFFKNNKI